MNKIVIIGSAGAGKSTLARSLSRNLHIKKYHLDRLFYRSTWVKKSREARIDILQNIVLEKQWIIDGGYLNTSELHLETADIIIFLGISPFICLRRIIKRHLECDGRTRRDMPMGSKDKLTIMLMLKVLFYPFVHKRRLVQLLSNYIFNGEHKQIFGFYSNKEVDAFLSQLEAQAS